MSSLSLPYTFPRAPSVDPEIQALPRDVQVSRDLEIKVTYSVPQPIVTKEPYVKRAESAENTPEAISIPQDDPLDDILSASQNAIEAYILDMPYTKMHAPAEPKTPPPLNKKRSRKILEQAPSGRELENAQRSAKVRKTPVKESLKKTVLKQEHEKHHDDEQEISSKDQLACHAENIMRMAVDSTMLSSFNNSFSSTFSNMHEDSLRRNDGDTSFPGKAPPMLDKSGSTLVEISASDLEKAVNEPYFK
ncbi:hypothetical protein FDK38_000468 [Candidozyma auris]|nr:hypothetical protein FDK38_000468 [[Candida] auris]